jgi:ribose 1,5-bisphosphokinase
MQAGQGSFVAVVGPSGAGKDTLINWLKSKLEGEDRVMFVRRTVTRDADGTTEDHDSLDRESFAVEEEAGHYAVCWEAHGLRYGIPTTALHHVENGGIAIANGSRRALGEIERVFGNLLVVSLTVDRDVLAKASCRPRARNGHRDRETPGAQRRSFARSLPHGRDRQYRSR